MVLGSIINAGAIVVGGLIGLSARRDLTVRQQYFLKTVVGILALYTGFRMVWMSVGGTWGRVGLQLGIAVGALVAGHFVGRLLGLQKQSNKLGAYARERYARAKGSDRRDFGEGFIISSILFCVGPLGVIGAFQEGLQNQQQTLMIKGLMDGMAALALARVLGPGTLLAALPVLALQGTLTLLARLGLPWMAQPAFIDGFCAVGGWLVAATSLVILDVRKVRLADYLPALIFGPWLRRWLD